ncbi:MAG: HAMP domain-containing histidine kinase [Clostridia bacterium]|nr:HAMP domain-containing histidine kinase [Clostridia bacterium]
MRKTSIYVRILLPALIIFLLLPPVVYGVFLVTARRQAEQDAETELTAFQEQAMELANDYLKADMANDPEQTRRFLQGISRLVRGENGNARLLLFADGHSLIYPYLEEEREAVSPLADRVARELSAQGNLMDAFVFRATAGDNEYLISARPSPVLTKRLTHIITYCPVSGIGAWIGEAGKTVFLISMAIAVLLVAVSAFTAHSITRPMRVLCAAAERISRQDFSPIQSPFPLKEPEALRLSMNDMSQKLEKADRAQKTFFQTISHELRTPLMSIGGYAQGIEQGVFPDSGAAAKVILEESERLTNMVNGLLTLSRMDQDTVPVQLSPVHLTDALGEALNRAAGLALKKGIQLELQLSDPALTVCADESLLGTALDNLLSNALRHARKAITVFAKAKGNRVMLSVMDDGGGISREDLPHLFERNYKGENGHFGIGLSITETAVKKCGGSIKAANRPEGGAVFTISLAPYREDGKDNSRG